MQEIKEDFWQFESCNAQQKVRSNVTTPVEVMTHHYLAFNG